MYGETTTDSMQRAINETNRRRKLQEEFNRQHGITPASIKKSIQDIVGSIFESDYVTVSIAAEDGQEYISRDDIPKQMKKLQKEMREAAKELEFERAAELRDEIKRLEKIEMKYR